MLCISSKISSLPLKKNIYKKKIYNKPISKLNFNNLTQIYNNNHKVKFASNLLGWYGFSVFYNIHNKEAIDLINCNSLTTSLQLTETLLITLPFIKNISSKIHFNNKYIYYAFLLIFGQYFGNYFGNTATQHLSISLVNIIKSCEPIMAIIMAYLITKQKITLNKFFMIFPIISGIYLSNIGDITYSNTGFILCILSNFFHIIKNIVSKIYFINILNFNGKDIYLLSILGTFIISFPDIILNYNKLITITPYTHFILFLSSFSYAVNSICAYNIISMTTSIDYSVYNIYKRVFVIIGYHLIYLILPTLKTFIGIIMSNIGLYYFCIL